MNLTILHLDYHRNGISGAPFHVALFREEPDDPSLKVAVIFDAPWHTAVLEVTKLARGDVAFGSNSWRGDRYESLLRDAIAFHQDQSMTGQGGA